MPELKYKEKTFGFEINRVERELTLLIFIKRIRGFCEQHMCKIITVSGLVLQFAT